MPYALCLMLLHFALRFWRRNAACMRRLWACIQAPRGHFPDCQMHAGMHAEACTFSSGLMPYALNQAHAYALHFGRRNVACMRLLWACIQTLIGCLCTGLHAGMHADVGALSPVPYALCILPDPAISSSFGWFCRDFGSAHATCTPACMPARQNLHTHLRASYILPFCVQGSILRAYTWLNTRGTDVC